MLSNPTVFYDEFVDKMYFSHQDSLRDNINYCAIAFGGEAGEVLNEVKKEMRPGAVSRAQLVLGELGDSLYYLTKLAHFFGFSLQEVMDYNVIKLQQRQKETGIPING